MLLLTLWLACGVLGAMLAQSKNRGPVGGAVLGLLLGVLGLLILACLRKQDPAQPVKHRSFRLS